MNETNLLKTPLPAAYLIPVFVTEQEEAYLLSKIEELGGTPIEEDERSASSSGTGPSDGQTTEAYAGLSTSSSSASASPSTTRKFRTKPTGWKDVKGRR